MNQLLRSRQIDPTTLAGRMITAAAFDADRLYLTFENGLKIEIFDDASYCCERRHMSTDDDVSSLVGCHLVHINGKAGPRLDEDQYDCHDTCFVEIQTNKGLVTFTNHNEHNGYYGGFDMMIREVRS